VAAKRVSDEALIESYARTSSVWKSAEEFGLCGQSVHERLTKLRIIIPMNIFTPEQDNLLMEYYEAYAEEGRLDELARIMARNKTFVATRARQLGLTNRKRSKLYLGPIASANAKRWHSENEHPRGMLGKTHSPEEKSRMSARSKKRWAEMTLEQLEAHGNVLSQRNHRRWNLMSEEERREFQSHSIRGWKAGWREIGGQRVYFRSRWEANYARYLEWLRLRGQIAKWEHEPETFWFLKILRGTRSYLPDFRVTENSGIQIYHEVKGWMDDRSRVKLQRMAKYHPHIRLTVIESKTYKSIEKTMKPMLPDWEAGK